MHRSLKIVIPAIILLLAPFYVAEAADIRAFHNINQLPLKQIYGLPSLDNSPLTEAGKWRMTVIANLSNTYNVSIGANDQSVTDIETFRASLVLNYAVRDNLQIGVEVPYVHHGSGFLDDFIYDWHDFFGMPQNDRSKANSDQMQVSYISGADTLLDMSDSQEGIGDLRINAAYAFSWNNRTLILSSELKLPTGDYDKLTGSGGFDFSMGLTINDSYSLRKYRITLYGGLAGVFMDDCDGKLAAIQNNFALNGRAGIGWQATDLFQLKLQIDAHTPLYDSELKELGDPAFQLTMGGSLILTENAYLDISVSEDINTLTAADVAFQLALVVFH